MNIKQVVRSLMFHPVSGTKKYVRLFRDMRRYNKKNTRPEFHAHIKNIFPCLNDWDAKAGLLDYYFWQDLWAAKKIFCMRPPHHYDIGSRVDGFIAHLLPFMPVTMIDIRPLPQKVEGLKFIQSDATNLENISDQSIISLSSLCAPEHFGLGRYGDPVDPEACFKALKSMQRVLAKKGHLYLAVPVSERSGVAFNAHRIFRPELVIEIMNELRLADFSVINGSEYLEHISMKEFHERMKGINYSGSTDGLFEFVRD